jgi:hypothetical protein
MTGTLRVRRSRGALSGVLLVLLGIWGAVIPFVGPYFHYAYTPDRAWDYTSGRLWLEVLPGAAVLLGGLVVLGSRHRLVAVLGSWLAAAGGAWFTVGGLVAARWTSLPSAGTPTGGPTRMVVEQIGFFTGLGVVIAFLAGIAMGRFTVVAARVVAARDAAARDAAGRDAVVEEPVVNEPVVTEPVTRSEPVVTDDLADEPTTQVPATSSGEARTIRRLGLGRPLVRSGSAREADTETVASDD